MAVGDAHVFPGSLTPVLTQLFFPKPPTTFLPCFCRDQRRKYTGKKIRFNQGLNSQPLGHESNMLTIAPPGRCKKDKCFLRNYNVQFAVVSLSEGHKVLIPCTLTMKQLQEVAGKST